MSFRDEFDQYDSESGMDEYFKFKEGENKIRVLAKPEIKVTRWKHGICYKGAPYCKKESLGPNESLNKKWMVWIIDRATKKMVLADLPYTVAKEIRGYMDSEDYKFEEFPMPFDITVTAKHAGTIDVEYSVLPAKKEAELTEQEQEELRKKTPIIQILDRMKAKAREKVEGKKEIEYPEGPDPKDIPF